MKKGIKNKAGFSLIEILVSMSIFVILMVTSLQIFDAVLKGQRRAAATSNLQESVKYFFEVIAKEIRMAQASQSAGECNLSEGQLFNVVNNNELYLKNYHDECVIYSLVENGGVGRFQVSRDLQTAFLSPAKISISNLEFTAVQGPQQQAYIVISLQAQADSGPEPIEMHLQTTIASRHYASP